MSALLESTNRNSGSDRNGVMQIVNDIFNKSFLQLRIPVYFFFNTVKVQVLRKIVKIKIECSYQFGY